MKQKYLGLCGFSGGASSGNTNNCNTQSNQYTYSSLNNFINLIGNYWSDLIEQFVPATTLWTGGNLIENGKFGRSKYKFRKPCQLYEMIDDAYPEPEQGKSYFQEEIFQFQDYFLSDKFDLISLFDFEYSDPTFGFGLILRRSKDKISKHMEEQSFNTWKEFIDLITDLDVQYRRTGKFL